MVGAKGGSSLDIGSHIIQKRPARGRCRVALVDASGRTAGRPARALGGQLLRVRVAFFMGSRLWEPSCSRLGTARRCEPPPAPRVPTLCGRGAQHPTPAGVPESARKNACLWRTGGQPGHAARRKNSCASRPKTHPPSKKTSGTAAVRTGAAGQRVQPL